MKALIITEQNADEVDICEIVPCDPEEEADVLEYKYYEYLFNIGKIKDSYVENSLAKIHSADGPVYTFITKQIK